ncbi:MAG: hypothetical protein JO103_09060 [Candidatus Eremiobacteraeota bacterium]|nr:hypothetical protein [Candidatus Eremiobacteraeota bacterium]MBV9407863.1 hypothetical protein [Candidatus Eremiobacteraeota bacterium]
MKTDYHFDELDLREEPPSRAVGATDEPTPTATYYTWACTATKACSHICCTPIVTTP